MAAYITKQRKMLLAYLEQHPHKVYSVTEILEHFKDSDISTSSVYRNLAGLEELEMIKRVGKNGVREAYYQYMNAATCKNHIHLHCLKCDRIDHLHVDSADVLAKEILQLEGFEVDKGSTVIYGICKHCRGKL